MVYKKECYHFEIGQEVRIRGTPKYKGKIVNVTHKIEVLWYEPPQKRYTTSYDPQGIDGTYFYILFSENEHPKQRIINKIKSLDNKFKQNQERKKKHAPYSVSIQNNF